MLQLIASCDKTLKAFGKAPYYQPALPHASLAWCLPEDCAADTVDEEPRPGETTVPSTKKRKRSDQANSASTLAESPNGSNGATDPENQERVAQPAVIMSAAASPVKQAIGGTLPYGQNGDVAPEHFGVTSGREEQTLVAEVVCKIGNKCYRCPLRR